LIAALLLAAAAPSPADRLRDPQTWVDVYRSAWLDCAFDETARLTDTRHPLELAVQHALDHCKDRARRYRQAFAEFYQSRGQADAEVRADEDLRRATEILTAELVVFLRREREEAAFHQR
jgi:hypothetical protein